MKNTQIKALIICMVIFILSVIGTLIFLEIQYYAFAFLCIFLVSSSFIISFLFLNRFRCMSKMLDGTNLIVYWQYSQEETQKNINDIKEENKGLIIMAIPFFSFVIIIISITVGFASGKLGVGVLITMSIIVLNMFLFKIFMAYKPKEHKQESTLPDMKKSYVYISSRGIYAHGLLHVWKGWGSRLIDVQYDEKLDILLFTYSYLRPYGWGRYTVSVHIPTNKIHCLETIKEHFHIQILQ
ncbi:MAG: hypothetical protein ACOWWR_17795 [Eubacteriales bacterium]